MKRYQPVFIAISILVLAWYLSLHSTPGGQVVPPPPIPEASESHKIQPERSAIGTKENPEARREYELAMLADPQTGDVPFDIRRKELRFVSTLPKKPSKEALRTNEITDGTWRSIGPYNVGGRTRALAIDVSNENVILAGGVSGGMWRSTDGGNSWSKTTIPSNIHSVSCIAQDTRAGKENTWYYGTGEFTSNSASKKSAPFRGDGVFKSTDGGLTWNQLASTSEGVPNNFNSQFQYIWKLLPNAMNQSEDEVYLATVGAIFRSVDGGDSWQVVLGRKLPSFPFTDLNRSNLSDYSDIIQTSDGVYYAVLSEQSRNDSSPDRGVFRSTDGINWVRINNRFWPRLTARTVMAAAASAPNEIYFSINSSQEMLMKYTYLSGDGTGFGGLWEDLSDNIPGFGGDVGDYDSQNSYNMVLEIHPENEDIVYLGGTNLYRSNDGFATLQNVDWVGGYDTANNIQVFPNHFVDQHALAFYPSDPNKMLSSNDGGVFLTENNIAEAILWRGLNNGFVTTQFYTVGLNEFGPKGTVMGGLQDNGTLIANNPVDLTSWNTLLTGDGAYSAITRDELFYYASFQFGKIYRFTLDKNHKTLTFARVDPKDSGGEDELLFINPYVLAPENQHMMYYAGGDVVWRNSNMSQIPLFKNHATAVNWERMSGTETPHGVISAISASYNPAGTVYYGTNAGILVRINNADSKGFTVDNITSSAFPSNAYVSSIAIDKKDSENVAVAFSNYNIISLFYSEDCGQTFENISGNLEEFPDGTGSGPSIRWVEIISKNQGEPQLIVGTSTGIYSAESLAGINTVWEQEGANTVGNVLVTMIKYHSGDGTIIAGTHGNGMYESHVSDVWPIEIDRDEQQLAVNDAYPNPFNNTVNIPFSIPQDGTVRARIYSSTGQLVKTILWADQFEGDNQISWDGTNELGGKVRYGTYVCRIEYENESLGSKLIFVP